MSVKVIDHPLSQHYLARLRDERTRPEEFRTISRKLATILAIEATRDLLTIGERVTTPLEETDARILAGPLVAVPILRAGLGLLDGVVDLFPEVSVGYIGLERDESTAIARSYYAKLPDMHGRRVLLIDPMLATGGSAAHALREIYSRNPAHVSLICVVAAPEGVELLNREFPDLAIFTAALDRELNPIKYILPGLGDFGDRLYGTQ